MSEIYFMSISMQTLIFKDLFFFIRNNQFLLPEICTHYLYINIFDTNVMLYLSIRIHPLFVIHNLSRGIDALPSKNKSISNSLVRTYTRHITHI